MMQISDLYHHMALHRREAATDGDDSHKFWDKQPVPKLAESSTDNEPIEVKTVADVRKKPYKLPAGYSWSVVDVNKPEQVSSILRAFPTAHMCLFGCSGDTQSRVNVCN
jgi:hypothetical protein